MHWIQSLILGIVEGLTEFLPVSSTGHLILVSQWMKLEPTEFLKSFEIIIQLGAVLAVVVLYAKRILSHLRIIPKIIVAFIPTGVLGLLFYKVIKHYLMGNSGVVLASLVIGGIVIIIFESIFGRREGASDIETISYRNAFLIGLGQALSMIPGVSRSAATILTGLGLGIGRKAIVEFSFLLAIPTMLAAAGLDLLKNHAVIFSSGLGLLSLGFVTSFVIAILGIKFFLKFIESHRLTAFGVYRIVLAILSCIK